MNAPMYHATTDTYTEDDGTKWYGWTIHLDGDYLADQPDFTTPDQRDASMMRHLHKWAKAGALVTVDKTLVQLN